MKRLIIFLLLLFSPIFFAEEKIIHVPDEMTIEMVVADHNGVLNGTYDMRVRLYVPETYERLWYQDLSGVEIVDATMLSSK